MPFGLKDAMDLFRAATNGLDRSVSNGPLTAFFKNVV